MTSIFQTAVLSSIKWGFVIIPAKVEPKRVFVGDPYSLPLFFSRFLYEGASLIAQLVKNPPTVQETPVWFLGLEEPLEKGQATHSCVPGLTYGSGGKESTCNAGDPGLIPGLGRFAGEGIGYPLQYSGLENSMDYTVHGVAKSWTWLTFSLSCMKGISSKQTRCLVDLRATAFKWGFQKSLNLREYVNKNSLMIFIVSPSFLRNSVQLLPG